MIELVISNKDRVIGLLILVNVKKMNCKFWFDFCSWLEGWVWTFSTGSKKILKSGGSKKMDLDFNNIFPSLTVDNRNKARIPHK